MMPNRLRLEPGATTFAVDEIDKAIIEQLGKSDEEIQNEVENPKE